MRNHPYQRLIIGLMKCKTVLLLQSSAFLNNIELICLHGERCVLVYLQVCTISLSCVPINTFKWVCAAVTQRAHVKFTDTNTHSIEPLEVPNLCVWYLCACHIFLPRLKH